MEWNGRVCFTPFHFSHATPQSAKRQPHPASPRHFIPAVHPGGVPNPSVYWQFCITKKKTKNEMGWNAPPTHEMGWNAPPTLLHRRCIRWAICTPGSPLLGTTFHLVKCCAAKLQRRYGVQRWGGRDAPYTTSLRSITWYTYDVKVSQAKRQSVMHRRWTKW